MLTVPFSLYTLEIVLDCGSVNGILNKCEINGTNEINEHKRMLFGLGAAYSLVILN